VAVGHVTDRPQHGMNELDMVWRTAI